MNINQFHNIYFIGIGGIGMSALARYFHANGKVVAGYDKTKTPLCQEIEDLGISIHYQDDVKLIDSKFLNKTNTLIVYTPAIPKLHTEFVYFLENDFHVIKRAEVLGWITKNTFCFAVAGTHGKTTTSSILGHIMTQKKATAFLGGISENYQSNLILGEDKVSVVEADEFDRSFLQLSPNIACVTSMDADHLDIYGQVSELEASFYDFSQQVQDYLVVAKGLNLKGITYGIEDDSMYVADNLRIEKGDYFFDIITPKDDVKDVQFSLPGRHNIMNAMAAVTMAHLYGIKLTDIKESLKTFLGVKRRFSYKIKTSSLILIDDYAHHPTEIKAVANSIKEMYSDRENLAVFQPHLFSRTRDFLDEFAESLNAFDQVILLDIYPARELPIEGISSSVLLEKINTEKKRLVQKNELVDAIKKSSAQIVAMLGAGDIGLMVDQVKKEIQMQENEI